MKRARPYDREAALDAAVSLFWTKGYHATSLKDLEAALSMRPGSIYAAFKNKEALFCAALERYFQKNIAELHEKIPASPSPLQGLCDHLRWLGQNQGGDCNSRACMLIKTLLDTTASEARIAEQARCYLDRIQAEIATIFDRAKACGELSPEMETGRLARRYQSDITALRIEAHRGTDRDGLADLAEDLAQGWEQLRDQSHN
ncbi:TetR family transcriptional regulator [Iodidimonas gelatinilytica]|uniref:TetR family transcriptional regulator n=1 Tax=Iodidimonas gelatinilytica TaxID=1236966 RepID=A0A5A7N197_9PROT|nr:TetR/AcrR family transcriptional regulator [Iodidimonas gelatinilytica]GER02033.1 TetR family transcriptional regulator [Iodidimonas gelatinilytica]